MAIEADQVPTGDRWLHEIKHDGYRMQLRRSGGRVKLFTRRGFDWTDRYPLPRAAAAFLKCSPVTIDGELVCAGADGIADFARLHSRTRDGEAFIYAFDVIELDGEDLRPRPLLERKAILAELLAPIAGTAGLVLVEHDRGDGAALFRAACKMGLEGIMSKRIDSAYRPGPKRSSSWVKVKNPKAPSVLRIADAMEG